MKQFEKKSTLTEEVKYSVEFPNEEKYTLRRERLYNFVCLTKRVDHE